MPAVIVRYGASGSGESHPQVRLPCSGILDVLVERREATSANVQHFEQLSAALAGEQEWLRRVSLSDGAASLAPADAGGPRVCYEAQGEGVLMRVGPVAKLILAGHSSVADACAHFALRLGCQVVLCDPREEVTASVEWPEGMTFVPQLPSQYIALPGMCTSSTAVVAVTHDPRIDDLAMMEAVKKPGELHWRHGLSANLPGQGRAPASNRRVERGGDLAYPHAHRPRFGQQDTGGNRFGDHGGRSSRATRAPTMTPYAQAQVDKRSFYTGSPR